MTEEPQKYTLEQKWDAIGKHMLSKGMENADLGAKLGGLHKDTIRKARNGSKPFAGTAIMDSIPSVFGAGSYDELIAQANAMPDMSPEKVMDAIYRTAAHRKMHLNEVVERSGYTSKLFSQPTIGIKVAYAVATKSFRLDSIADMVTNAAGYLEAPRRTMRLERKIADTGAAAHDDVLVPLVRKLQKEHDWTDTQMATALGITRSQYMTTIQRGRFQSDEERNKLPGIFGFDSLEDMLSGKPAREVVAPPKINAKGTAHWEHLYTQKEVSRQFGNPEKGWKRD